MGRFPNIITGEVRQVFIAFYIVMGFLLALFAASLVLWIIYAAKTGLQTSNRDTGRIKSGARTDGEKLSPAEGGKNSQEPSKVKKPRGP